MITPCVPLVLRENLEKVGNPRHTKMCRERNCVGSSGACRPNVPTFGCRADMSPTCRRLSQPRPNIRPQSRERGDRQSKARNLHNTFRIQIELRCLVRGFFGSAGRTRLIIVIKGWASWPEVGHRKVRDLISIPNVGENGFIERSQISNWATITDLMFVSRQAVAATPQAVATSAVLKRAFQDEVYRSIIMLSYGKWLDKVLA